MKTATRDTLERAYERLCVAISVLPIIRAGVDADEESVRVWNALEFAMPEIRRQVWRLDFGAASDDLSEIHSDAVKALALLECIRCVIDTDTGTLADPPSSAHVSCALSAVHERFTDVTRRLDRFLVKMPEARVVALSVIQGGQQP